MMMKCPQCKKQREVEQKYMPTTGIMHLMCMTCNRAWSKSRAEIAAEEEK